MQGAAEKSGHPTSTHANRLHLVLSGLPNLSCQTYYFATAPVTHDRVCFWLLGHEEIGQAHRLLDYWHTVYKIKRPVWPLADLTPYRAVQLLQGVPQTVLVDVSTIHDKRPSLKNGEVNELTITPGQSLRPAELAEQLIAFGYDFSGHASEPGYFARRGGVMDVYPVNLETPVRLEFTDNDVASIQTFNPINKRTQQPLTDCSIIARRFAHQTSRSTFPHYLDLVPAPVIIYQDADYSAALPDWPKVEKQLHVYDQVRIRHFEEKSERLSFEHAPLYHNDLDALVNDLQRLHREKWQIALATHQAKELHHLFKEKHLSEAPFLFWPYLRELTGFKNETQKMLLLTDSEIFGETFIESGTPRKRVDQAFIMEVKPGDYIVHLDHGIGRFTGMTNNAVEGITKEYFVLEYAEGDKLYVPVETADKISKYIGIAHPKLHRLSGGQWYQLTRKVKQEAKVLAQELLKIYAKRELTTITPFGKDTPEDIELAKSFPYKETPDQGKAIADVRLDLEKETPMDRLICGDVGFGKTEVAVRAALKAVMNKTQVALLAPTTILTQQHYDTFRERLKRFPAQIGILSRFESAKEQHDTIEKLKAGTIDIVIGTHRLLSPDVNFKRLGLIIIDEEQRFGVKAKEKLKSLRTHSHVLTLTATPIPRTLNIALSGVRDVSIIETPPEGRLPIQTHIEPYAEPAVKKSIENELERDGQVYYLHNKVETIAFAGQELQKLIPRARIGIAHGRLPEKDLAAAMQNFDTRKTNILLCSTIIENGLDLPNVNTLIVDNATNFGLAQLYQLRGRVGRGERQAYAYFFFHRKKLKGNAQKRLQALMEAKKLGSGFQLALRDLEIRGAGNILGKEQHGKVSAIGLSLYTRLLAQAIEELKYGKVQEPVRDILIDVPLEAYIPKEFLHEEERLLLYQKMASITNGDELKALKEAVIRSRTREEQRSIPVQLLNLFEVLEIRILCQQTDISHIDTTLVTDEFGHRRRRILVKFLYQLKAEQLGKLLHKNEHWQFTDDSVKIDLQQLGEHWVDALKSAIRLFKK